MAENPSKTVLKKRLAKLDAQLEVLKQQSRKLKRQQRKLLYRQVGELVVRRTGIESLTELSKYKFVSDDVQPVTMAPTEAEGVPNLIPYW